MTDELWSVELGRGFGVIELGATREEIARRLTEHDIQLEIDDEDDWLWVDELGTELRFKTTKPAVLREIVVEDDQLRFASLAVIGRRLHEVMNLLKVSDEETMWRLEQDDDSPAAAMTPEYPTSDAMLLKSGTLWIPALGLGLGMARGEIATVRLRKPEEAPQRGLGPLTLAQRELSARNDLSRHLQRPSAPVSRAVRTIQMLLGLGLAAGLGMLVWQAADYQRRWNTAPVAEGKVIAVNPPGDPIPDEFTVAYQDQAGKDHQVVFGIADVYILREVGDKVEVRYLPEAPDRPLGPARVRDAAFVQYTPWGMGMGAVYLALQVAVGATAWLTARRGGAATTPVAAAPKVGV